MPGILSSNWMMYKEYSQNGDKPKRRQSKRRQAETVTNHNGDIHLERTKTATVETVTNRNGDIHFKRTKTATVKTSTNRNGEKPSARFLFMKVKWAENVLPRGDLFEVGEQRYPYTVYRWLPLWTFARHGKDVCLSVVCIHTPSALTQGVCESNTCEKHLQLFTLIIRLTIFRVACGRTSLPAPLESRPYQTI